VLATPGDVNPDRRLTLSNVVITLYLAGPAHAWRAALVFAGAFVLVGPVPRWLKRRERPQAVVIPISTAIAATATVTVTVTGIAHAAATGNVVAG
jgi:hypothetical protein